LIIKLFFYTKKIVEFITVFRPPTVVMLLKFLDPKIEPTIALLAGKNLGC